MPAKYINLDGSFYTSDEKIFSAGNRAFSYGDGFFETIRCRGAVLYNFNYHWQRITLACKDLKYEIPLGFTADFLQNQCIKLLQKNRIFKGGRVRITFFRAQGGLYTPENNQLCFLVETKAIENEFYSFNPVGLKLGIYTDIAKPSNLLSKYKTINSLPLVLASLYKKTHNYDDVVLLNEKGNICETSISNIFLIKNKKIYTPPISESCVDGVMRKIVIEVCLENGIDLIQEKALPVKLLSQADEIFTTNSILGIQSVLGYKIQRYFHNLSQELSVLLNKKVFG